MHQRALEVLLKETNELSNTTGLQFRRRHRKNMRRAALPVTENSYQSISEPWVKRQKIWKDRDAHPLLRKLCHHPNGVCRCRAAYLQHPVLAFPAHLPLAHGLAVNKSNARMFG